MTCHIVDPPGGARAIVCGKLLGPRCIAHRCGRVAGYLCDWPVGDRQTCSAPICARHAHALTCAIHYCPHHHALWVEEMTRCTPHSE